LEKKKQQDPRNFQNTKKGLVLENSKNDERGKEKWATRKLEKAP